MTSKERMAQTHLIYSQKANENPRLAQPFFDKGLLSKDTEVLNLLKYGEEDFRLKVAERILAEREDDLYLNLCPKCKTLAKTPVTRQCHSCKHHWHDIKVADFKVNSAFSLAGRHFYITGEVISGEVSKGDYLDLTILGINCQPKIESIEFALKRQDGVAIEEISLGTSELIEKQKQLLIERGTNGRSYDILNIR